MHVQASRDGLLTTMCLLRHGETDWNLEGRLQGREDVPLNDYGRQQARLAGRFLAREPWDLVISSPLKRAHETAWIVASEIGITEVVVMPEFVERDYGAASGLTVAERKALYPDGVWPGLESREDVRRRCLLGLETVLTRYRGRRIVLVSHGAAINSMLAAFSGGEIGSGKTSLHTACLSTIRHGGAGWEIERYNVIEHLSTKE